MLYVILKYKIRTSILDINEYRRKIELKKINRK